MKLLVDMNLSPSWVDRLARQGFEVVHWSTIGAATAPDVEILTWADEHHFVVITNDLDFSAILAASSGATPSLAWCKSELRTCSPMSSSESSPRHSKRTARTSSEILEAATDTAHAARASNPIEKMLAHELTASHFASMRLLKSSENERLRPADAVKYVNAAARMMDAFQTGCLPLQKLKTQGQQRVVVQYQQVNVTEGGQAVVTGAVHGGSRRKGRGNGKNRG